MGKRRELTKEWALEMEVTHAQIQASRYRVLHTIPATQSAVEIGYHHDQQFAMLCLSPPNVGIIGICHQYLALYQFCDYIF